MTNIKFEDIYQEFLNTFGISISDENAVRKCKALAIELHFKQYRKDEITDKARDENNMLIDCAKDMMNTLKNLEMEQKLDEMEDRYEERKNRIIKLYHLLSILSCQCECRHLRLHPIETSCSRLCCRRHSTKSSDEFDTYKNYIF